MDYHTIIMSLMVFILVALVLFALVMCIDLNKWINKEAEIEQAKKEILLKIKQLEKEDEVKGYAQIHKLEGLNRTEFDILTYIKANKENTQAQLDRDILFNDVSLATIKRGVIKLISKDLIVAERDAIDVRRVLLTAT